MSGTPPSPSTPFLPSPLRLHARAVVPSPPRCAPAAIALAAALAGCGGTDAPEDAPALLGTSIPAAAQNARGAPIPAPAPVPYGVRPRRPGKLPDDLALPPDPFEAPETPTPPVEEEEDDATPGMQL